jgi:hypothetical protein
MTPLALAGEVGALLLPRLGRREVRVQVHEVRLVLDTRPTSVHVEHLRQDVIQLAVHRVTPHDVEVLIDRLAHAEEPPRGQPKDESARARELRPRVALEVQHRELEGKLAPVRAAARARSSRCGLDVTVDRLGCTLMGLHLEVRHLVWRRDDVKSVILHLRGSVRPIERDSLPRRPA